MNRSCSRLQLPLQPGIVRKRDYRRFCRVPDSGFRPHESALPMSRGKSVSGFRRTGLSHASDTITAFHMSCELAASCICQRHIINFCGK